MTNFYSKFTFSYKKRNFLPFLIVGIYIYTAFIFFFFGKYIYTAFIHLEREGERDENRETWMIQFLKQRFKFVVLRFSFYTRLSSSETNQVCCFTFCLLYQIIFIKKKIKFCLENLLNNQTPCLSMY
jgi:hypothetical protein